MYNVALNIWIFLKLNIFSITKRRSLYTKPVNPLTHLRPIRAKNFWFQKIFGFVWTGAINWYLNDLVTVPLICCLRSALIYLQQKEISYLHSRNLLEITAPYNFTRSAYQDKCSFNTAGGCVWLGNPDFGACNQTRNPKTDFISEKSVLRMNLDFMGFLFNVWLGNLRKDLQNYSREQRSSFC